MKRKNFQFGGGMDAGAGSRDKGFGAGVSRGVQDRMTGRGGGRRQPGLFGDNLAASGTRDQIEKALKSGSIGKRLREDLEARLYTIGVQEQAAARRKELADAAEAAAAREQLNKLRQQRLAEEAEKEKQQRLADEQEKERLAKLAEERQARLQKEDEEARALRQVTTNRTKANLSESLVDKLAPDTLKSLIAGGHGISGNVFGGLKDNTKEKVVDVLKDIDDDTARQANRVRAELDLFSRTGALGNLTPNEAATFADRASTSMGLLSDQQRQQLVDRGFDLNNLAFTPGEGLFGLKQQPLVRDINTGETVARTSEAMTGPIGAGLAALGVDTRGISFPTDPTADRGGRQDDRLRILEQQQQQQQEQDEEDAEEEVLTGFTGDQRGTGTGFTSSMGGTGIASTPAAGNYMDYINYAFRPVNLATPFAGQPTQQITGFNPLFGDNPVYRAHGGFIGFMDEPLNIMYPSNGNMVVHDGISSILKKYKEIRSEL